MTKKTTKAKPVSSTEQERQELLHRLWLAQTRALVQKIESTPATELEAATLNVARQVLSDNGISTDTIAAAPGQDDKHARVMREAIASLPDVSDLDTLSDLPASPDFEAGRLR
jgi:hypothetical protein